MDEISFILFCIVTAEVRFRRNFNYLKIWIYAQGLGFKSAANLQVVHTACQASSKQSERRAERDEKLDTTSNNRPEPDLACKSAAV